MNRDPLAGSSKQHYWIGMTRNSEGGYEYTDGSPTVNTPIINYLVTTISKNFKQNRTTFGKQIDHCVVNFF